MCGICGVKNKDKTDLVDKNILTLMNNSLIHRGPDEEGYFVQANIGLGMRRLSIIDVSGGHQPIYNEDRNICVVCNGEIYNYLELRKELEKRGHLFYTHSDTEVIVHLYEESPEAFIDDLSGMFAIALYDCKKDELILVRDRLGIKPLYYTCQNGSFLFASELKALLQHPRVKKNISLKSLSDYLTYLYIPASETIFEEIYKLPPAHILTFKDDTVRLEQYWELNYRKQKEEKEEFYSEKLKTLLKESVKMHLISEVPLGAFLSGGIDSSTIVALMSGVINGPLRTFSVGFDYSDFNELKYAKLVSQRFETEHHEINLKPDIIKLLPKIAKHFDEPFADSSAIPTYLISEFAKSKVTVCLAGDGGDELFAGYGWTRRQKFIEDYNHLPKIVRSRIKQIFLGKDYAPDQKGSIAEKAKRFLYDANLPLMYSFMRRKTCFSEEMKRQLFKKSIYNELYNYRSISKIIPYFTNREISNDIEKLLFVDTKTYLPEDCLYKVDQMSMVNSLEVRVPFLDHRVVEFVTSMPFKFKMRNRCSKYILKKIMKDRFPPQILRQRKLGFTIPLNRWLRYNLDDFLHELLLRSDSRVNNFFNTGYVKQLIETHQRGEQALGSQIFALLVLELWLMQNKCSN
jgi:asparagine synthase (glutamine-hydrolysing)